MHCKSETVRTVSNADKKTRTFIYNYYRVQLLKYPGCIVSTLILFRSTKLSKPAIFLRFRAVTVVFRKLTLTLTLFRQICCPDDHHRLQHDLHQLEQCAAKWQMRFAPTKCFALSMTLRTNSSQVFIRISPHKSYVVHQVGVYPGF